MTLFQAEESRAQSKRRLIQLSGVVFAKDSIMLPGVHVFIPKAGRGSVTNSLGFFSLAVQTGDSIVFSSVGYKRQHYIVPNDSPESLTILVELVDDVTYLQEVTIMPFPTEEVFKEAVLALNIPLEQEINPENLNMELFVLMMRTTPMDANMNYRYYMDQYASSISGQYAPRTSGYLNPFNWVKFLKQMRDNKQ